MKDIIERLQDPDTFVDAIDDAASEIAALRATAAEYKSKWMYVEGLNKILAEQSERRLALLRTVAESHSVCDFCLRWSDNHALDCALAAELR